MAVSLHLDRQKATILMARKGYGVRELATEAGLSIGTVSVVYNGKSCSPRTMFKIAKALDVDVTEVIKNEKE